VAARHQLGQLLGGRGEGDDEGQVEQQFERRGGAMAFVRIPSGHAPRLVVDGADAGFHGY
jgi:hypothetical protein